MIRKYKEQPIWYTLMTIAIFAFAVFFLCKCCMHLLQFPGAVNEYREAADVQLTQAFLNGDNPYRLQSIEQERDMPPVLYQYSFLNSLVCAGLALLLGGRVILAHYILAVLAMIGSGILSYRLIDRYSQQTVLPMLGAVLTLFCHWRFGYLSTTPISLGIFLILLTFTVAVSPKIKHKAIITAFLCVLLFYTKLYFVTIAGAIFIFFLLYDRKEAFKYLGMCVGQGALSILLIQIFWPLYYTYSLYFINGTLVWQSIRRFINIGGSAGGYAFVIPLFFSRLPVNFVFEQFGYLIMTFGVLFIILLASLIVAMIRKSKISIEENDVLCLAVIQIILQGLCMFVVGREDGAYLSYYLQLWMPYVILASLICLERFLKPSKTYLHLGLLVFVTLISLYFGYRRLPLHMMTDEEIASWQQAQSHVEKYTTNVYYAPELAYLAMEQRNHSYYNNGHTGVVNRTTLELWDDDQAAHVVFPHAGEIIRMNLDYQQKIQENIRNHAYTLVTIDDEGLYVDETILTENDYHRIDVLPLAIGNAVYDVEFWIPLNAEE